MSRPGLHDVGRMEFLLTLRRRGIGDQAVLRAMDEVPRGQFVEPEFVDRAYADQALPIACGQTISQPYVVAYMTEQLGVAPASPRARGRHRLGLPGRGAVAAGARGGEHRALSHAGRAGARRGWPSLGYENVEIVVGDGFAGVPGRAPYDRIVVTAAAETLPQTLIDQLGDDGVMILPLGPHGGSQHIIKLTKSKTGIARENLIAVRFVPLLPGQAQEL